MFPKLKKHTSALHVPVTHALCASLDCSAHLAPEARALVRNERAAEAEIQLTASLVHANTHPESLVHILVHRETDLLAVVLSVEKIPSMSWLISRRVGD